MVMVGAQIPAAALVRSISPPGDEGERRRRRRRRPARLSRRAWRRRELGAPPKENPTPRGPSNMEYEGLPPPPTAHRAANKAPKPVRVRKGSPRPLWLPGLLGVDPLFSVGASPPLPRLLLPGPAPSPPLPSTPPPPRRLFRTDRPTDLLAGAPARRVGESESVGIYIAFV